MFFQHSFKITFLGMLQIIILGGIGFLLIKRGFLKAEGLSLLSKIVIELTLPFFIFSQLITGFSFSKYRNWWWFPLLSIGITLAGFGVGKLMVTCYPHIRDKRPFISLVGFQNSGYLPLVLFTAIFSSAQAQQLLIYLFLFLMGFNLVMWSLGVWYLTYPKECFAAKKEPFSLKRFPGWLRGCGKQDMELAQVFSPPVVATVISLLLVALGLNRIIPGVILKPLKMVGECTIPLAMLVVGGNLATIPFNRADIKTLSHLVLAKLLLMPLVAFIVLLFLQPHPLISLLIITQAAMPSATSLSLISRHYQVEQGIIDQGILLTHLVSIITIPLFLSLFLANPVLFH